MSRAGGKEIVDEFGRLEAQVAPLKPLIARREAVRAIILGWHAGLSGDEGATEAGKRWRVLITPRDQQQVMTLAAKKKLLKLWGPTKFLARCSVPINALPGDGYSVLERRGPRHLRAVPILRK